MKIITILDWKRNFKRILQLLCLIATATLATYTQAAEEPLTLGVFPRNKPAETTAMYTPLSNYLSERLGRKVLLVTSKDFDSFWREVAERRFDIVHFNQYHYINSAQTYKVIAYNQEFGKSAVAGAIYVRKDSGITSVSQLRGKAIMFGGGKDAMLSYIAPRFLLMQAGLQEGDVTSKFAVSPPNALIALYHRQADAAGGGDILIDLAAVKNAINTQELTILATTERLLFLPWAVKRNLTSKLSDSIQSALLELGDSDKGKSILKTAMVTGVAKAGDKDYDPHRKMISAVFGTKFVGK